MKRIFALAVFLAAGPVAAQAQKVVDIDANTRIRWDPKLMTVIGTDQAAAGSMRRAEELKSGAAGGDDERKPLLVKPRAEKAKPKRP